VKLFVKRETRNFSRYSYIKDMIAENDQLDKEINQVEAEIEMYKQQIQQETEVKHKKDTRLKVQPSLLLIFIGRAC